MLSDSAPTTLAPSSPPSPSSPMTPPASRATSVLPSPGDCVHLDFRDDSLVVSSTSSLRVLTWNIERGYKLDAIIAELSRLDADIIALQEVDIGCERTSFRDTGVEIAKSLKMNYVFVCEFEELRDPMREPSAQGGGVHGNAILSRFPMDNARCLLHEHQPFDWERDGHIHREPRHGRRCTGVVRVLTPRAPILVYTAHMELFCGLLDRVILFSEIIADARAHISECPHQIIMGDFNTLAHGIARLSPKYCTDIMRILSVGSTESEWWVRNLLTVRDEDGPVNTRLNRFPFSSILPRKVLKDSRNPGFYDPFDANRDTTLSNYRGWFTGKLDWLLLRGFHVFKCDIANHDFSASDHKLLFADVRPDPLGIVQQNVQRLRRVRSTRFTASWTLSVVFVTAMVAVGWGWLIFGSTNFSRGPKALDNPQ